MSVLVAYSSLIKKMKNEEDIIKKIKELEEEKELASDINLKDKLSYGIYLLEWMLREKEGCADG